MAHGPDSRYYVHASTHAARAQQQYLFEEAGRSGSPTSRPTRGSWFDLRTDWWIVLAVVALFALAAALMTYVR